MFTSYSHGLVLLLYNEGKKTYLKRFVHDHNGFIEFLLLMGLVQPLLSEEL